VLETGHRRAGCIERCCLAGALLLAASCGDPVLDDQIRALGGETPGVKTGPLHRPGQPCLLCHSSEGGVGPAMSVAGTVYQKADRDIPAEGAAVEITDASGVARTVWSNCAGNFYVTVSDWQPLFPLRAQVSSGGIVAAIPMESKIGRDGSCSSCHQAEPGPTSAGRIYLVDDPLAEDWPQPICRDKDDD
jgi:hypothetical protein